MLFQVSACVLFSPAAAAAATCWQSWWRRWLEPPFFFFFFLHVISQILKSSWRRCSRGWGSASGWIKADVNGECKFASPSFMLKLQIESLAGEFCPRALAPALIGAGERIAWSHWWVGRPAPSALKLINLLKPWQIFSCSFLPPRKKPKKWNRCTRGGCEAWGGPANF